MSDFKQITPFSVAEVVLDDAIQMTLDYQVPTEWLGKLELGMRVKIPVKKTIRQGTIICLKEKSAFKKLLNIQEILSDKVFLPPDLFSLALWMANYYCTSLDKVITTILPSSIRGKAKPKEQLFIKPQVSLNQLVEHCQNLRKLASSQARVLDVILKFPKGIFLSQLLELSKASRSPIEQLIKLKLLSAQKVQIDRSLLLSAEYFPTKPKQLNKEQAVTLQEIQQSIDANEFCVRLIHGITGSGKTEVYLQAIDHALQKKKGVLFLVPEIALTSQIIERLKSRFSEKIAILHHRLSLGERHDGWHALRNGDCQIAIGARSAIFAPVSNLGLIIVDEEHESSYKQSEEMPSYHARDVAVMRGKITQSTVLLGSATPSLESYQNALTGKYALSVLKNRADVASLPLIQIIDMAKEFEKAKGFTLFSAPLLKGIEKRMLNGEQTILFLNRRGYHTSLICLPCKKALQCPHCDVNLTFHLAENLLSCHLCDYRLFPPPKACPTCKREGMLKFKGAGTEMVERALHAIFPEIRTLRLDKDTTSHKGSHELLFKQFRSGKADVLIGTQMISKGLHFPCVTLVGILNADASLQIPDFRASETTFQLLTQVSGRSGRGALKGEVMIQTHLINHPVITLAKEQKYETFFEQEIALRQLFHYPPFTRLVKFSFKGKNKEEVLSNACQIREALIKHLPSQCELLPVVPCGHAKIKEEYRFQFIMKASHLSSLLPLLQQQIKTFKPSKMLIDVDSISTFF